MNNPFAKTANLKTGEGETENRQKSRLKRSAMKTQLSFYASKQFGESMAGLK